MKKKLKISYLIIALVVFAFFMVAPLFKNQNAQHAFALLMLVAFLWITEAIPLSLTGLLIPVFATFMQLTTPREAFKEFAHPILFLFMGGFVLAGALSRHSLDQLLAQKLIRLAKGNFYRSAILLMLATSMVSAWISNTSTTAMMLPLGIGMLVLANKNGVSAESKFLLLGIAYSANIGGIITLVGTAPNAIGAAILDISFSQWMMYGVPVFLLTFPVMIGILTFYFKPDRKLTIGEMIVEEDKNPHNKTLAAIFIGTVVLWMLESVIGPLLNIEDGFSSLVAIVAIFFIFITDILSWDEIINSIQWEVLLLFGGGLTLGSIIDKSGLGGILVRHLSPLISILPFFIFLWIIVACSIILTEFMSNTASAALSLPILFSLANQFHINPMILVFPATIAATYGFMMPAGTPPNAIVYSTGLVPQRDMIKSGFLLNLISSFLLTGFFYLVLK